MFRPTWSSPEDLRATLAHGGVPPFITGYLIPVQSLIARGTAARMADKIRRLTGPLSIAPACVARSTPIPHSTASSMVVRTIQPR